MNGRTILGSAVALALAASAACGPEEGKRGTAPEGGAPAAAAPVQVEPVAPAPAARVTGEALAGTATAEGDAGPGGEYPLSLVLGDGGRLGGELALRGVKCAISGMVDEEVARGWLTCPAGGAGEPARRGTLVGEKTGAGFAGSFAASDDGAASVIGGSWKAGK